MIDYAADPSTQTAVVYPRQSRTEQNQQEDGQSASTVNQIERGKAYAAFNGWSFDEEMSRACADLDTSSRARAGDRKNGKRSWQKRPGLMRLYTAAKAGRFKHLIVYDMARLGGDATELHLIREAFDDVGVVLHVIAEGLRMDKESDRIVFSLWTGFAEKRMADISRNYRDNARTRIQKAHESAVEGTGGGRHYSRTPAWIEIVKSVATTPEELEMEIAARGPRGSIGWYRLHPEYSKVIRKIVALRLEGKSYTKIASILNDPSSPGGAIPTFTGSTWTPERIHANLTPDSIRKMRGYSIYGWRRKDDDPLKIITPGVFPPLITEEEAAALEAVQETQAETVIGGRERQTPYPRKRLQTGFLLAGLLTCAYCGRKFFSHSLTRGWRQYRCTGASGHAHPSREGQPERLSICIGANRVEVASFYALAQLRLRLPDSLPPIIQENTIERKRERAKAARSLEQITEAVDQLLELLELKKIRQNDYDRRYEKLMEERERAEAALIEETPSDQQAAGLRLLVSTLTGESEPPKLDPVLLGPDEEPTDTSALRLIVLQLFDRIECPIVDERIRKPRSAHPIDHVRLVLKSPLPDGTTSILSAMYKHGYQGARRIIFEGPSVAVESLNSRSNVLTL